MVRVEAYIPVFPEDAYLELWDRLRKMTGGFTEVQDAVGNWTDKDGALVREDVRVLIMLLNTPKKLSDFEDALEEYKIAANQEAVLYTCSEVRAVLL